MAQTHTILFDAYIQDLPGYSLLQGIPARNEVTINYTIIHIKGPKINGKNLIDYHAVGFTSQDASGQPTDYIFGPTLRVKRGQTMYHKAVNSIFRPRFGALSDPQRAYRITNATDDNGFTFGLTLNLHTHGIFGSPGLLEMPHPDELNFLDFVPETYTGGDNIFIGIPPVATNLSAPVYVIYRNHIALDHLPGLHWVHGHSPGAVALSNPTANALWIVEDGDDFDQILPDSNGCKTVRTLLQSSPELILHMANTDFAIPPALVGTKYENMSMHDLIRESSSNEEVLYAFLDNPNQQFLNEASYPYKYLLIANATLPSIDIILLNGGYLPRIKMPVGQWQRFRMINTGIQNAFAVNILKNSTTTSSAPCDMALIAKDGVYPLKIPRTVGMLYFSPASRVEILVRCNGTAGQNYTMGSGMGEPYAGSSGCPPDNPNCKYLKQPIATIELTAPSTDKNTTMPLIDEACTPMRPDYVADMRDEALRSSGADKKVVKQDVSMTDYALFGCKMNNKFFNVRTADPFTLELGTISEIRLQFVDVHAFHIHVQPFQLTSLPNSSLVANSSYTNFYKEGDFHDTLYIREVKNGKNVTIRLNPAGARFSGIAVMHCHLVAHEDTGCMSMVKFQCPGYGNDTAQPELCNVDSALHGTWNASRVARDSASSTLAPMLTEDTANSTSSASRRCAALACTTISVAVMVWSAMVVIML